MQGAQSGSIDDPEKKADVTRAVLLSGWSGLGFSAHRSWWCPLSSDARCLLGSGQREQASQGQALRVRCLQRI